MTITNTNLNDVAFDIIGVVSLFGLTQIYYNTATVEHGPLYKGRPDYRCYLGLCALSTITALTKYFKYF